MYLRRVRIFAQELQAIPLRFRRAPCGGVAQGMPYVQNHLSFERRELVGQQWLAKRRTPHRFGELRAILALPREITDDFYSGFESPRPYQQKREMVFGNIIKFLLARNLKLIGPPQMCQSAVKILSLEFTQAQHRPPQSHFRLPARHVAEGGPAVRILIRLIKKHP